MLRRRLEEVTPGSEQAGQHDGREIEQRASISVSCARSGVRRPPVGRHRYLDRGSWIVWAGLLCGCSSSEGVGWSARPLGLLAWCAAQDAVCWTRTLWLCGEISCLVHPEIPLERRSGLAASRAHDGVHNHCVPVESRLRVRHAHTRGLRARRARPRAPGVGHGPPRGGANRYRRSSFRRERFQPVAPPPRP